jgi:putative hemolysin
MPLLFEAFVILFLILLGGFFAAAEVAVLAARRDRLDELAALGKPSARRALELARNPSRFLPTAQAAGALLVTLAAVYAGAAVVGRLAERWAASAWAPLADNARPAAIALVALALAMVWLVAGQMVPKRLALAAAERWAMALAAPLRTLTWIARPLVGTLTAAAEIIPRLLGAGKPAERAVSIEDIEQMIRSGTREGVLDPAEQSVAEKALRLGDRAVREIMRPRVDIDALDVDTPPDEIVGAVAMSGFSRVPIHEGDLDHIIGFVYTKDLLRQQHLRWPMDLRKLVRPPLFVPESLPIDRLLEVFRQHRTQMAIVLDEYGGTEGLVTMEDVLEELVGEIHDEHRTDAGQQIARRDENSWLVGGAVNLGDLLEAIGLERPRDEEPREFSTVGGLILSRLGHLPRVGERVAWRDLRLEVVEMDGLRIERLLVTKAVQG